MVGVIDIRQTATHAGGEVATRLSEHDHTTARHVFAAVVARALDDGDGTRVTHTEALAHTAIDIQLAAGGSVETRVAGDDVVLGTEIGTDASWWQDADSTARESLAKVVVALAFELQVEAAHGEGAERLTCGALELDVDGAVGQTGLAVLLGNHAREHRAHGAVGVLDGVVKVHFLLVVDGILSGLDHLLVLHAADFGELAAIPVEGNIGVRLMEKAGEIDGSPLLDGRTVERTNFQKLCSTDDILQMPNADFSEILAHLLGKEGEVVDDILGTPHEAGTEALVLCGHTHGTGVGVAFAHHHTAQNDERQRAERELVSTEHGHDDDILGRLQLTVGLQTHLIAKAVLHQCLLRLCKANLWRDTRKAHTACWRSPRTALSTANHNQVGFGLCHTCGNGAYATFGYQLHADGCRRVDILQVEDKLCQVFDRINVMMRWGRDERDAGDGIARLGDNIVHLEAGQLTAFAWLGTLCHLDLNLLGIHQIFSRHAEAARCNLLGLAGERYAVHLGVIAGVVLAALARVRACAEFVHGQSKGLVRLDAQCTETHGTRHKVPDDAFHWLHLVDGERSRYLLKGEVITEENGGVFLIDSLCPLLEFLV